MASTAYKLVFVFVVRYAELSLPLSRQSVGRQYNDVHMQT